MTSKRDSSATHRQESEKDLAATYDKFKTFEGRRYTGVKVGRGHKWYYDRGEWKEKKITPDLWEFTYATPKRRAGNAPEGSGVPVGTEYHWYIAAHQNVRKLNANDYTTSMTGLKFKVAHKRADNDKWSASEGAQRRRLIKFLSEVIESLEKADTEEGKAPAKRKAAAEKQTLTLRLDDASRRAAARKTHTNHRTQRAAA
jgi:hypothetical protein